MKSNIILTFLFFLFLVFCATSSAENVYLFQGNINFVEKQLTMTLEGGDESLIKVTAEQSGDNEYKAFLNVEHLIIDKYELSSQIESLVRIIHDKDNSQNYVEAEVKSNYSLLNRYPIRDLSGFLKIKDNTLFLNSFVFGHLLCGGYVSLESPYDLDLTVNLDAIDMDDFLDFWMENKTFDSKGPVSGEIKITGILDRLALKGKLESREGFIKKLKYDKISLNIEGVYPDMRVTDSVVSKSDGISFNLKGFVDLSDKKNFKRQIKSLTVSPLVRGSASETEWTVKRLEDEDERVTEIKYLIRDEDSKDIGLRDSENMLGIERSMKF